MMSSACSVNPMIETLLLKYGHFFIGDDTSIDLFQLFNQLIDLIRLEIVSLNNVVLQHQLDAILQKIISINNTRDSLDEYSQLFSQIVEIYLKVEQLKVTECL